VVNCLTCHQKSKKNRKNECFKCGQEGHFSKDCTVGESFKRQRNNPETDSTLPSNDSSSSMVKPQMTETLAELKKDGV